MSEDVFQQDGYHPSYLLHDGWYHHLDPHNWYHQHTHHQQIPKQEENQKQVNYHQQNQEQEVVQHPLQTSHVGGRRKKQRRVRVNPTRILRPPIEVSAQAFNISYQASLKSSFTCPLCGDVGDEQHSHQHIKRCCFASSMPTAPAMFVVLIEAIGGVVGAEEGSRILKRLLTSTMTSIRAERRRKLNIQKKGEQLQNKTKAENV